MGIEPRCKKHCFPFQISLVVLCSCIASHPGTLQIQKDYFYTRTICVRLNLHSLWILWVSIGSSHMYVDRIQQWIKPWELLPFCHVCLTPSTGAFQFDTATLHSHVVHCGSGRADTEKRRKVLRSDCAKRPQQRSVQGGISSHYSAIEGDSVSENPCQTGAITWSLGTYASAYMNGMHGLDRTIHIWLNTSHKWTKYSVKDAPSRFWPLNTEHPWLKQAARASCSAYIALSGQPSEATASRSPPKNIQKLRWFNHVQPIVVIVVLTVEVCLRTMIIDCSMLPNECCLGHVGGDLGRFKLSKNCNVIRTKAFNTK